MSITVSTPTPMNLNLGNVMGGKHPWTGGEPIDATYAGNEMDCSTMHPLLLSSRAN